MNIRQTIARVALAVGIGITASSAIALPAEAFPANCYVYANAPFKDAPNVSATTQASCTGGTAHIKSVRVRLDVNSGSGWQFGTTQTTTASIPTTNLIGTGSRACIATGGWRNVGTGVDTSGSTKTIISLSRSITC